MNDVLLALQVVLALGIVNVWLLRFGRPTPWRGAAAQDMREEFRAYGLPGWACFVVGAAKLTLAALIVVGIWYEPVLAPAAWGLALFMLGAVLAHARVRDPLVRSLPALTMLVFSLVVALGAGG